MARRPLVVAKSQLEFGAPNRSAIIKQIPIAPEQGGALLPDVEFVFLCFTNRCGSAYFGDLLKSTGVFGPALETLNAGTALSYCTDHGIGSFREYFAAIVRRDAVDGRYIVKAAPEQIALLTEAGILDDIMERTAFLFIRRADTLGQAISRVIAQQNRRWAWDSPTTIPDGELVFSARAVAGQIRHITVQNQSFEQFFALNGIDPVRVEYERLLDDPQAELDRIASRLRLPPLRADPSKLHFRQQRNEINDSWRSMFLSAPPQWDEVVPLSAKPAHPAPLGPPEERCGTADIIAHVRTLGDISAPLSAWIGRPGSGLWIEGFSISPKAGLEPHDLRYCAIRDVGDRLPWARGGEFCGTRSLELPLRGVVIALSDRASARYHCSYSATFADGTKAGPVMAGELLRSNTMAALEALKVEISPIETRQVDAAAGPASMEASNDRSRYGAADAVLVSGMSTSQPPPRAL